MYWPRHRPQLTGIDTESVDCGARATQMGLDALSEGDVQRSIPTIRTIGQMGDGPTNYTEWDRVIDVLGGRTEGFSGEKTNDWDLANQHLLNDGFIILATDYGQRRRLSASKVGSLTFSGFHSELIGGARQRKGGKQSRTFDSLLDGRYRGCPDGPVWVSKWEFRSSAEVVGTKVKTGGIFAVLLHPDKVIEPGDPGAPLEVPAGFQTLPDILSDLMDLAMDDDLPTDARQQAALSVDSLRILLGLRGNPEADEKTPVASGINVEA